MDRQFPSGVAIVAGGSGAIGGSICAALARAGADIAVTYRSRKASADAVVELAKAAGVNALAGSVDHTDPEAMKEFVDAAADRFGRVHSVVYAAGPHIPMKFLSAIQPAEWKHVIDNDVNAAFNLIWATLPHLKAGGGGAMVAITTAAVEKVPMRDICSAGPKAAVEMLFRGVALEEGRHGIRANCIAPGFIDAGLGHELIAKPGFEDWVDGIRRMLPMKSFGAADDVAQATLFLLSEKAKYITGQSLAVDGGLQL